MPLENFADMIRAESLDAETAKLVAAGMQNLVGALAQVMGVADDGTGDEVASFLLLLLLPLVATAAQLTGRVVKAVDGDTVYVLNAAKEQHTLRLSGIDVPERG